MMGEILLCADVESLKMPPLIGLDFMSLKDIPWLDACSHAAESRDAARRGGLDEVWVVSSEEMEAINLASAICKDSPGLPVFLVAFDASGSERSRAHDAGVKEVLGRSGFAKRFKEVADSKGMTFLGVPDTNVDIATFAVEGAFEPEEPPVERLPEGEVLRISPEAISNGISLPVDGVGGKGNAFVVSVMSGSGGVGKSTLVATSSYIVADMGLSCVVVDCDLQFGDMIHLMGDVPHASVDDVLMAPDEFVALVSAEDRDSPFLVSAPSRLEKSEELSSHLVELIDICAASFDIVLVNTGSSWSDMNAQLLERSSCTIFMMDQRASSVRSCQHALELCMRMGVATGQFVYVLNRCERGCLFTAMDIANAMQGVNVVELKDGGPDVEELLGCGLASELALSKNELTTSLMSVLSEVLP